MDSLTTVTKSHIWLAPHRPDRALGDNLRLLAQLDCIDTIHVFAQNGLDNWFCQFWDNLGMTVPMRSHPGATVERGALFRLALEFGRQAAANPLGRHVIVSRYPQLRAVADWAAREFDSLSVALYPNLNASHLAHTIGTDLHAVDATAAKSLNRLRQKFAGRPVNLSLWSDNILRAHPDLADKHRRRILLQSNRFSDYARLLGLRVYNDRIPTSQTASPRPLVEDLLDVFLSLADKDQSCLFLHWANTVLVKFPVLKSESVRMRLFGAPDMTEVARTCGLLRNGQILQAETPLRFHPLPLEEVS